MSDALAKHVRRELSAPNKAVMQGALNAYSCVKAIVAGKRERNAFALLQAGNHSKQVVSTGIALVAEHTHQALRVLFHFLGKGLKPNCRVHVVTQQHLTRSRSPLSSASIASRNRPTRNSGSRSARALMVFLKSLVSGMSVSFLFSVLVVVPKCLGLFDVL